MAACCDDMAASSAAFSYASESLLCSASAAESSSTSGCSSRAIHSRPSSSRCGRYSFRVIGSVRSSKRLLSTRSRALTAESCSMARTSRRHAEKRSSSICSTGFLVPLADGCLPATAVSMGDYVAHKQENSDNALIVERGYNTTKKVQAKNIEEFSQPPSFIDCLSSLWSCATASHDCGTPAAYRASQAKAQNAILRRAGAGASATKAIQSRHALHLPGQTTCSTAPEI